jgi:hypothetical protein
LIGLTVFDDVIEEVGDGSECGCVSRSEDLARGPRSSLSLLSGSLATVGSAVNADGEGRRGRILSQALAVVAAGGALLGWVGLVGGIREYARFRAAGIPSPAQTASLLPRETLIAEGLSALLPGLAIALGLSVLTYVWARKAAPSLRWERLAPPLLPAEAWTRIVKLIRKGARAATPPPEARPGARERRPPERARLDLTRPAMRSTIALVGALVGYLSVDWYYEGFGWLGAILGVVLAAIVWTAFRSRWLRSPAAAAAMVLLVTLINGGAAAFLQPLGSRDGEFDSVIVTRRGLETVSGFYLTRSGAHVYVAVLPAKTHANPVDKFAILAIPESEVELIQIGPAYSLREGRTASSKMPAVVTQLHEPEGPGLFQIEQDEPPKQNGTTANFTTTSTTTTINKSTTNNKTTITTTIVDNGAQQSPPPTLPVVQSFVPDGVVPASDHFCFPIGAAYREATIGLRFSAPTLEARGDAFRTIPDFRLGAHQRLDEFVMLDSQIERRLQAGQSVPTNVKVTAASSAGAESTVTYRLKLQRPTSRALFPSRC